MLWCRTRPDRGSSAAFTLVELAIVLALIGLVGSGALMSYDAVRERGNLAQTRTAMDRIERALALFVSQQGRLPCPATTIAGIEAASCTTAGSTFGLVPWSSLGLPLADVIDGWNNAIDYAVTQGLATGNPLDCDSGNANITGTGTAGDLAACYSNEAYGCTGTMAWTLISHGKNGLGARTAGGVARANPTATRPAECLNAGLGSTCAGTNVTEFRVEPVTATNIGFDDIVRARPATRIMADAGCRWQRADYVGGGGGTTYATDLSNISNSQVTIANTTAANATTSIQLVKAADGTSFSDSESGAGNVNFGSIATTTDPDSPVADLGGTRTASCLWLNTPFDFGAERLSVYLEAQMGEGETNIDTAGGTADGFTVIVIPGTSTVTASTCGGDSGVGMAYSNSGHGNAGNTNYTLSAPNGIFPLGNAANKMAIEFDNWTVNANDPSYNHVAILRGDSTDHGTAISSASTYYNSAPGCPSSSSTLAVNGAANWGCTLRRQEVAWMDIRRSTTSTAPAYSVTQPAPFTARIDMTRQCNQGCTSCSAGGGNYMQIKVWADCPDADLCSAIEDDNSTALNTPLSITNANVTNFSSVNSDPQSGSNAGKITIVTTTGTYDLAAAGFKVGDHVRFTSGTTTDEFTVAAISGNVMTASYGQDDLSDTNYNSFTLT
ncbi:MAG: hypothetical protein HQL38_12180, partial [Alphaproteobacteria bacterium]|nr:hypothetical protein [Alphaproteobacteria bacterium]